MNNSEVFEIIHWTLDFMPWNLKLNERYLIGVFFCVVILA